MFSYWERESFLKYDHIVIGAGITGLSTAIELKCLYPGERVLVLERGFFPTGASTMNAGFACMGSVTELLDDLQTMSEEQVVALFAKRKKGLGILRERLGDERIGYAARGSFELIDDNVKEALNKLEYLNGLLQQVNNCASFRMANEKIATFGFSKKHTHALDRFKHPELQGEVRFGLPEDFASVFLSDVLTEYASLHPRIMLNVECDLTLNLFARFKKKAFDLVLVKMNKPEDFPNGMDVWSEALEWVGNENYTEFDDEQPVPLVLSPQPCVYRARAIHSLEKMNQKWRIVFSSHSYAGTVAAVKAGMGITVLPRNMVPEDLKIIRVKTNLPKLDDTHISLLKHHDRNLAVNSFERFVVERLKP